jgi:hypothetical protein
VWLLRTAREHQSRTAVGKQHFRLQQLRSLNLTDESTVSVKVQETLSVERMFVPIGEDVPKQGEQRCFAACRHIGTDTFSPPP